MMDSRWHLLIVAASGKNMKVAIFDTHQFEKSTLIEANKNFNHDLNFFEVRLTEKTISLAQGYESICIFTSDRLNRSLVEQLAKGGTKLIALRSAGYNHVDLNAAFDFKIKVVRVPEYSPYAVAEHAVGLILSLDRKIHKAYNRVRENNFSLEGLVGFDLHDKTVGVIGTGRIGKVFMKIMKGFGCRVLAYDNQPDLLFENQYQIKYTTLNEVLEKSDIVSLHVPLFKETFHLIDEDKIKKMKSGAMLINTSRGGLVDTKALIRALKTGQIGAAGLDVYEEEENLFFQDHSSQILDDDVLARLMTFPNVLLTSHQGFLTKEALSNIATTTLSNISAFEDRLVLVNEVLPNS